MMIAGFVKQLYISCSLFRRIGRPRINFSRMPEKPEIIMKLMASKKTRCYIGVAPLREMGESRHEVFKKLKNISKNGKKLVLIEIKMDYTYFLVPFGEMAGLYFQ